MLLTSYGLFKTMRFVQSINNRLARELIIDDLTKVHNRRYFYQHAKNSQHSPYVILIIDIDHFKMINDEFGHDVGDEVLKFFANSASRVIRKAEFHGRFGGEEWLFVLPETEVEFAQVLFDRLSEEVAKKDVAFDLGSRQLTFSMGATQRVAVDTIKSMIDRADKLLYQAKKTFLLSFLRTKKLKIGLKMQLM